MILQGLRESGQELGSMLLQRAFTIHASIVVHNRHMPVNQAVKAIYSA